MTPPQPSDTWQLGNPYERYVGRWSRLVAPAFLTWLRVPPGQRWLDVGCGTGALCSAILAQCDPASVTGVEPSEGFLKVARDTLPDGVTLCAGHAAAIPLADGAVDAVVSGLVLNFVPELDAALDEITRVAAKGATFGAYVWDYAGKMELMRYFWDAAVALDQEASKLVESLRFPICQPNALVALWSEVELRDVQLREIDVPTTFRDFDDFWNPFLGGQGPAPSYAMSLSEKRRVALRERIHATLPIESDGSIPLIARAWAVRGRRP